jgi:hypothetical protein
MNSQEDFIGKIIPIGDGTNYRMKCYLINEYSSWWILEYFAKHRFLWWRWSEWRTHYCYTNYGAGETEHDFTVKKTYKEDDDDECVMYCGEGELDFLGIDY